VNEVSIRPLIYLFLALVILAVFAPVLKCDFVQYDDPVYVTANGDIQSGPSWKLVRHAFTSGNRSPCYPMPSIARSTGWSPQGIT
jgi:hypothetical protein